MPTNISGYSVPLNFTPGYGYGPGSGPPVGGRGVGASPKLYSSTFYGSNVKSLFPLISQYDLPAVSKQQFMKKKSFGRKKRRSRKRKSKKRSRKSRKSRKRSRKRIKKRSRKRSKNRSRSRRK